VRKYKQILERKAGMSSSYDIFSDVVIILMLDGSGLCLVWPSLSGTGFVGYSLEFIVRFANAIGILGYRC
jgi:hypothetical protein